MTTTLDVVIPVLNEERALPDSVARLHGFMSREMAGYDWRIVIADNGSTDSTPRVIERLEREFPRTAGERLERRGRGRALHHAWSSSGADMVGYMDVDLSTDLAALPVLARAVGEEGYDLAIASRLRPGAVVVDRPLKREIISRCYSLLFRSMFFTSFADAQCGFKVVSRRVVQEVLPLVEDLGWFFDSELLILADKNGYRIKECPVTWTDDPDTRVKIIGTALGDLRGLLRLRFGGLRRASRALAARGGAGSACDGGR